VYGLACRYEAVAYSTHGTQGSCSAAGAWLIAICQLLCARFNGHSAVTVVGPGACLFPACSNPDRSQERTPETDIVTVSAAQDGGLAAAKRVAFAQSCPRTL